MTNSDAIAADPPAEDVKFLSLAELAPAACHAVLGETAAEFFGVGMS